MLSPYRVLDLTDERGIVCGFMFGELGADIICVEPPEGSPARRVGPFADDKVDPERSLFWWAYARNKRSIALDLTQAVGQDALRRLIGEADVLIESNRPGEMDRLGFGYEDVRRMNPRLVYVSISAFGQTGPKAGWAATDLTVVAAGGPLWLYGDADRPPVRMTVPQAFAHASADAAAAALVALHERQRSGRGQHVDVSAQQSITLATQSDIVAAAFGNAPAFRAAGGASFGRMIIRLVFPASDGHVSITFAFGSAIGPATRRLMHVICEEGFCDEAMRDKDWIGMTALLASGVEPYETFEEAKQIVARWTATRTKQALLDLAMEKNLLIAPASTTQDVVESAQLASRDYFQPLTRPDGGGEARQLGPFARFHLSPIRQPGSAPRIGEHGVEILEERRTQEAESFANDQAEAESEGSNDARPLEGVKILDFMWAVAGPMATRMLADYGAEVIRIESTTRPDACRTMRPFVDGNAALDNAALFHSCNASKSVINLDLTNPRSKEVILDLARWADVACESFSPGTIERLGFGYDALRAVNPKLIMLSTCLMGQTGPLARFAGYGNLAAAIAGFHELVGWPDRDAAGPYNAYTDYIAPKFNASSILAALEHRRRTGEGQYIDLAQAETALHFLAPAVLDTLVNGRVAQRLGNRDPHMAPHGCFAAAGEENWIALAVQDDAAWRRFCDAAERPELADDARFSTTALRKTNEDALEAIVAEWIGARDAQEVEILLQSVDVACHRVLDSAAALADPQLEARGHFVPLEGVGLQSVIEDTRSKLSRTPARIRHGIPSLGRDNFDVLDRILGYDGDRISELVFAGIFD